MPNENYRKLFIGGLDQNVDESELHQYFARYGDIEKCSVYRNLLTGLSRGFGFITYYDSDVIDKVIADEPHGLRTKQVQLKRAIHKHQFEKFGGGVCVNRLYVRGTKNLTVDDLKNYFSQFGTIVTIDIIKDYKTGLPRGFAFITFNNYDSVDKIVLGDRHLVKNHLLLTRKAKTKEQMRLLKFQMQQQEMSKLYPQRKSPEIKRFPSHFQYSPQRYPTSLNVNQHMKQTRHYPNGLHYSHQNKEHTAWIQQNNLTPCQNFHFKNSLSY